VFAPGIKGGPKGQYKCGHNLLLAHGRTYRLYQEKYAAQQGGKLSMALDGKWGYPYTNSEAGGWRWLSPSGGGACGGVRCGVRGAGSLVGTPGLHLGAGHVAQGRGLAAHGGG
jgi:hypothetical protein